MSSRYINSEFDTAQEGLVMAAGPSPLNPQLGFDPISLAAGGSTLIKPVSNLIGSIGGIFGNKRRQKRQQREAIRNALYGAGVSRTKFTDYHSNNWGAGKPLVTLIQQHGQPAVDYINQKAARKINDEIGRSLAAGFPAWKRQKESELKKAEQQRTRQQNAASSGASTLIRYGLPAVGGLALLATAFALSKTKR